MDYSVRDADADRTELPDPATNAAPAPRIPRWPLAFGVVVVTVMFGLGFLISRQGWATTESQVYDATTTAKAKTALALSKRVSAWEVNVDTAHAVATLTGTVPTQKARDVAGQIVADTSGVRDVRNLLTVDPRNWPEQERNRLARRVTDLETQTALSEALQDCPELAGAKVHVRVADGIATLDGIVLTDAQKARADEMARTFPGVQQLSDRLK